MQGTISTLALSPLSWHMALSPLLCHMALSPLSCHMALSPLSCHMALSPLSWYVTAHAFLVSFACVSAGYIQCWSNLALGSHRPPHNPRHLLCQSLERADKSSQAIRVLALEYSAPTMNICIVCAEKRSSLIALYYNLPLILIDFILTHNLIF